MTILTFNKSEIEKKIGKVTKELEHKITMMGTPIEEVTNSEVSVEIFPNRPDLLSMQNFCRAFNQYKGKSGISDYKINEGEKDYKVIVEKSVKGVRPFTVCCVVRGLNLDEKKIIEIIELQEKLHNSIGRKRKKVAIGIYPLDKIKMPIRFMSKHPDEIKFIPLESSKEMNGRQIIRNHPAGLEYGELLKDHTVYPIFIDAEDKILSMPPIINSQDTGRVSANTKDIFIECSGHSLHYLKKTLNILVSTFYEMGGKIYSMEIKDSPKSFKSPNMAFEELEFKLKDIEKTLGITISKKELKKYFAKMGLGLLEKKDKFFALIPPTRTDILHWIDLSEEIAIAYGYENFEAEIPEISTIGQEAIEERRKRVISEILVGLGLLEVNSVHLTTKKDIKKMYFDYSNFLEVENSKTEKNILRIDLLTNLLEILSENSDASYPQKLFEIGKVFSKDETEKSETGILEKENLSIALIDEGIGFTDLKQILDYLFKMLGLEYEIEDAENTNYIAGRVGKILVDKKEIGFIGEIAPRVLRNWKLKMPTVAMEICLDELLK